MSYLDNACLVCGAVPGRPCYGPAGALPVGVRHEGRESNPHSGALVRDVETICVAGEFMRSADDPDVTYTVSIVKRSDDKKFVRLHVCLAGEPGKGFFVDMEPYGALWVGEQIIERAKGLAT